MRRAAEDYADALAFERRAGIRTDRTRAVLREAQAAAAESLTGEEIQRILTDAGRR